jgi:predicted PurR-regulated permease PerM
VRVGLSPFAKRNGHEFYRFAERFTAPQERRRRRHRPATRMNEPDVLKRIRRRLPSRAERRVTFGLKVLALIAVTIYLLIDVLNFFGAVRTTGLLVVGALFLAYLIYPLVRRLNRYVPVVFSIVIVYAFITLIGAFGVTLVAPQIGSDLNNFGHALPGLMLKFQHELTSPTSPLLARIPLDDRLYLANLPSQFNALAQQYGLDTLQKGLPVLLSAASLGAAVVIIPILTAYMLLDASNVRRQILGLFPLRRRAKVHTIINELDGVIGGFIRGQLIDGAIVGVMIFIMLTATHVPYALLIGIAAGILNFIPYAGAVIGFIPSVILALAYNGPGNALLVALLFAVIQQIDGNFVAPRVLKDNVGLSPLYIIVAILVGSELFGLAGTFLAVPVAAMLRVLREQLLPMPAPNDDGPGDVTKKPRAREPVKTP